MISGGSPLIHLSFYSFEWNLLKFHLNLLHYVVEGDTEINRQCSRECLAPHIPLPGSLKTRYFVVHKYVTICPDVTGYPLKPVKHSSQHNHVIFQQNSIEQIILTHVYIAINKTIYCTEWPENNHKVIFPCPHHWILVFRWAVVKLNNDWLS